MHTITTARNPWNPAEGNITLTPVEAVVHLSDNLNRAMERIAELEGERDGWIQSAKEFSDGVEYYRDIVDQIGNLFGVAANTADDGTVSDSVLRAKVFELVSGLLAERAALLAELRGGE